MRFIGFAWILTWFVSVHAQVVSFAVVADPRSDGATFKAALKEITEMRVNPDPMFSAPKFILCCGDMDPIKNRYEDYRLVLGKRVEEIPFLPVLGNHDLRDTAFILDSIIPPIKGLVQSGRSISYYLDREHVRVISVDAYVKHGRGGCVRTSGIEWVKSLIDSTPARIHHIFIAVHEPAFPRFRHIGDSFDKCKADRDAFWNMLVRRNDRVRAVFVGHTHAYYRMQVRNPESACANNPSCYPQESDGIYQIDAGAAGNGEKNTVVQVQVKDDIVTYRTLQAADGGSGTFTVVDSWGGYPLKRGKVGSKLELKRMPSRRSAQRLTTLKGENVPPIKPSSGPIHKNGTTSTGIFINQSQTTSQE